MALLSGRTDAQKHVDAAKPTVPAPAAPPAPIQTPSAPVAPVAATPPAPVQTPEEQAKAKVKAEAVAKEKAELDFINGGVIMLSPELAEASAPVRARSDKQVAMDGKVETLHGLWVKANKPNTWDKMVGAKCVATYFSEPERSADLHKLIDRAATFHKVRVRYGTPFKATEKLVSQYKLPENYVGREVISFAIMDKRPRATSGGKDAAAIVADKQ